MSKLTTVLVFAVAVTLMLIGTATADSTAAVDKLNSQVDDLTDASSQMKSFIKEKLLPLCTNSVFVAETAAQNAKGITLDAIKSIDKEWIEAEDELPIHSELTGNACANEIKKIASEIPAIGETFIMDNQGANVGQNALTSDYWQGDEAKWEGAYNGGQGGIVIGEAKLDRSTGQVDQKVSLPIFDADGNVIGAACFGIDPNSL